ncbi:hypothetical protein CHUAL_010930 [Chamberlinius hualienensis]
MFIASANNDETSPSRSLSPAANDSSNQPALNSSREYSVNDGMVAAASPVMESQKNRSIGFNVCDILMDQRSTTLKTVPLIVVSGNSRNISKSKSLDFMPIRVCDDNQRSPCSNSDHSLSPSSVNSENVRVPDRQPTGQQDISRRLKFGVDRILSNDNRSTSVNNSHNTTGEICGPSCTCADDLVKLPNFVNSRPTYRNSSSNFEYSSSHPSVPCNVNRHTVTTFYPTAVLPTPYASNPWTLSNHYGHHHHHLLHHPITSAVFPMSHLGSANQLIDHTRNYHHHYQNHHHHLHGGLSLVSNANITGTVSGVSGASAAAGSASNVGGKRKRSWSRAVFSNLQRKGLEKRFQIQKYITKPDRRQLAATLGLTDAQVKVWFQNRRMKWRHSKEAKEELAKQSTTSTKVIQDSECRKIERTNNMVSSSEACVDKPIELCPKSSTDKQ